MKSVRQAIKRERMEGFSIYGQLIKNAATGLKRRAWKDLACWPAIPHPEQARLDEFAAYPSQYQKRLDR